MLNFLAVAAVHYFLTLGREPIGFVKNVEGPIVAASVVEQPSTSGLYEKKHLLPAKVQEMTIALGFGVRSSVFEWIADAWTGKGSSRSGSVIVTDQDEKPRIVNEFTGATIVETTFPVMDMASKDPGFVEVVLQPQSVTSQKVKDDAIATRTDVRAKSWLPSNFRLAIDGIDCSRVAKIGAIRVRQPARGKAVEFSNLKVWLTGPSSASWTKWHDEFVVKGRNADAYEKKGSLELLDPTLKTTIARIDLVNVGIMKLSPDGAQRLRAELYVERMSLVIPKD